jgi:tetratricopeptide (TPR) repeat protein
MQNGTSQNLQEEQAQSLSVAILPGEVEAELQRILASPTFRKAPRHCRFLSFVVWKALAGEAETVKEYLIGLEVFDRPSDYDPGTDPIVRAEARRLRSRLVDYYQTLGKLDQVRIGLPKGIYVPVFYRNGVKPPLEEMASDLDSVAPIAKQRDEVTVRPARKTWRRWLAAAAVVIAVAIAASYFVAHRPPKFTNKDSIVLADFDNATGDALFDDTLKQGLSVQIEQSPFLYLVSDSKVNATLKLMGRAAGDRLTPDIAREVCLRTASTAMLAASIARLGSQYVIGLQVVDCNTGGVLAVAQEQAANKEAVLKALDASAISLRSKLGESLSSVEKYATPLALATTPSLEALKAYSLARKTRLAKGDTAALPLFKRAVELDPNFAIAYAELSTSHNNLNEIGQAAESARKAYELREKVSERERLGIEATYYLFVTGELEKAAQSYEQWQQIYPRDAVPYGNLGFISATLGNLERALEETLEAMRLRPDDALSYANLGTIYVNLNRLDEAEASYKQAETHKLKSEYLLLNRYGLAFLNADGAQMAQLASAAMGKPGLEDSLLGAQADTEAWYGKLKNARELTRRAMDSAQHNDAKETAATYQAVAALREAESGNREQARADASAAVGVTPNRYVLAMAALALARAGDTAAAEKLATELDKRFPLGTLVQRYWLPTIRAAVALERKDPNRAVELLKVVSLIELGQPTETTVFLCPVYLRGEAYLMLHDGNAAATEFQKFIDHWGVVGNFEWGALARLGVARAYALDARKDSTSRDKARAAYQNFLTLWKDADPDIPILKQAKAEYTKLQ